MRRGSYPHLRRAPARPSRTSGASYPVRRRRGAEDGAPCGQRRSSPCTARGKRTVMAWVVLIASGLLETAWAIALDRSAGFTRLIPSIVFLVTLVLSMVGLAWALREIPVGTGYAVWVG